MIAVTTASRIEGYQIVAYKGRAQGVTFEELLKSTESLGANAVLNTCFDDAIDVDTLFHGTAVVVEPILVSLQHLAAGKSVFPAYQSTDLTNDTV